MKTKLTAEKMFGARTAIIQLGDFRSLGDALHYVDEQDKTVYEHGKITSSFLPGWHLIAMHFGKRYYLEAGTWCLSPPIEEIAARAVERAAYVKHAIVTQLSSVGDELKAMADAYAETGDVTSCEPSSYAIEAQAAIYDLMVSDRIIEPGEGR